MRLVLRSLIVIPLTISTLLAIDANLPHIKSALAAYQSGDAAARDKHFQEAIDDFRNAIEIEPTFREAFEGLIAACLSAGKRPEAAAAATQLLEIEPGLIRFRLLLAQILSEENQTERALAQFSLVLRNDPLNADALYGFAKAAKRMGLDDRAAEAIGKGRKQYPLDERFHP